MKKLIYGLGSLLAAVVLTVAVVGSQPFIPFFDYVHAMFTFKGTAANIPATCTEGFTYWATDTNVGYVCSDADTWTVLSSGDVTSVGNCTSGACDGTTMTWGDGTGPVVWTFSVTGTDPTMTATASAFALAGALTVTGAILPGADDTYALGATGSKWSDLWLGSGAVINWNAGDVLLTHSSNTLAFTGGTSYTFDAAVTTTGALLPGADNTHALGATGSKWSDLWLGSGAVINWDAGDVLLTHSANTLAFTGGTSYTFDAGVTTTSMTVSPSATPTLTFSDSDNAPGTAAIYANSSGGANDIILTIGVEDSTGESTPYVEIDGVTETIDLLKSVVITGAQFKLPSANTDPTATAGYLLHDTTVANHTRGALRWHDGTNIRHVVDMVAATAEGCTNAYVVAYDSTNDLFYCKEDATAGAPTMDSIGDAAADGTIALGGYEITFTSTLDEANHSVITIYNNDADRAADTILLHLKDDDAADANAFFLKMTADADGTPATIFSITGLAAIITPDTTITGDLTITGADLTLGTGLKITGGAGVATFTDLAGTSEVLALDLRTENTAKWTTTSAVATMDFGALNMATTGTIAGGVPVVTKNADGANTFSGEEFRGAMVIFGHDNAISDITLPDYDAAASAAHAKIGDAICFYAMSAYAHTIHPAADDKIRTSNGTLNAAGAGVTYTTASTPVGGFVCFMLTDAASDVGHWSQLGMNGTWPIH